jgi:hypothetical protein
MLWVKE